MTVLVILLYVTASSMLLVVLAEALILMVGLEFGSIRIGDGDATYIEPETIAAIAFLLGILTLLAARTIQRRRS